MESEFRNENIFQDELFLSKTIVASFVFNIYLKFFLFVFNIYLELHLFSTFILSFFIFLNSKNFFILRITETNIVIPLFNSMIITKTTFKIYLSVVKNYLKNGFYFKALINGWFDKQ